MAPLTNASRVCLRGLARPVPIAVRAISTSAARMESDVGAYSYSATFKGESKANNVPDFGKYVSKNSPQRNKLFGYFMVGGLGAVTAAGAKSTVESMFPLGGGSPVSLGGSRKYWID